MGSCLSKSGKKGKADEVDKAPYTPAAKDSSEAEKPKEIEEIPVKTDVQLEKGRKAKEPVTVKQTSEQHPSKPETIKPPGNTTQPSVSKISVFPVLLTPNFFQGKTPQHDYV